MTKKSLTKVYLSLKSIEEILKSGIEKIPSKFQDRLKFQIDAIFHAYELKLITYVEAVDDAISAGRVTSFDIKRENEIEI